MSIKKYVLKTIANNQIASEDSFELVRSKKNPNEIHVINSSSVMSKSIKVLVYETDKTNEVIIEHFDKIFVEYDKKMKEYNSILKQQLLTTKFDAEFDKFLGKPVGEIFKFFGKNNDKYNEEDIKRFPENPAEDSVWIRSFLRGFFFTMFLYLYSFADKDLLNGNSMTPVWYGLIIFGVSVITTSIGKSMRKKSKTNEGMS